MTKHAKIPMKPLVAATVGTTLELYDFTLFGFLVPIFAPKFFPTDNMFLATLLGYSTFAIGYLCQPLGAIFWGYIGDRLGRRTALCSSLYFMGIATLLMGLLPTYATIGISAPILMILARVIQGISTGGELSGGFIFTMEHTNFKYQGLAGGLFNGICSSGMFLGSLAGYLCNLPTMPSWAWRIPFLLGFVVALLGIYLRKYTSETPEFLSIKKEDLYKLPLIAGIKKHYKEFICFMLIAGFPAVAFQLNFIYFPILFKTIPTITADFARLSATISLCCLSAMLPISGFLSDQIGKAKLMQIGASLFLITIIILFLNFAILSPLMLLSIQITLAICLSMFNGPWCALVTGIFDKKARYSCIGAGHTTAMAVFGGTAPLVGTILTNISNGTNLLELYIGIWACFGILGVSVLKKLTNISVIENNRERLQ